MERNPFFLECYALSKERFETFLTNLFVWFNF